MIFGSDEQCNWSDLYEANRRIAELEAEILILRKEKDEKERDLKELVAWAGLMIERVRDNADLRSVLKTPGLWPLPSALLIKPTSDEKKKEGVRK